MSRAKRKGYAEEKRIADLLGKIPGWSARRQPGSGAIAGFPGDVLIESPTGHQFTAESKRRASGSGFKTLRRWLGANAFLWLREDRTEGMVVMPESVFLEIIEHWRAE